MATPQNALADQTLASIVITPPTVTGKMLINTSYTFTAEAFDQSGQPMVPQPVFTWQASGPVNVSVPNGIFNTSQPGLYSLQASVGPIAASAADSQFGPMPFP